MFLPLFFDDLVILFLFFQLVLQNFPLLFERMYHLCSVSKKIVCFEIIQKKKIVEKRKKKKEKEYPKCYM